MSQTNTPSSPDPSYTVHATTAAIMSGGLIEILTWIGSLYHLAIPASVGVAAAAIATPFLSVVLKKTGVASA